MVECVPAPVASAITHALEIPTIGIGAGGGTSGQVLVFHDLLGMMQHPHHAHFVPRFCKQYASVGETIREGLESFVNEVESGAFPGNEYSPYMLEKGEEEVFLKELERDRERLAAEKNAVGQRLRDLDEYAGRT